MTNGDTKRTILVVDDSYINRALLRKAFSGEFIVEEAGDGEEALEVLRRNGDISAVVLDIRMPKMDGYAVLDVMNADEKLRDIPVVVDTASDDVESQLKALDHGAVDVLIKPFNLQLALHRVRNLILRREAGIQAARSNMLEQQLQQSEIDRKSGIYNKHGFIRRTSELLKANPDKKYVILRWDVARFKVFNDVFGVAAGDAFIASIGEGYIKNSFEGMVYGHWDADHFVMCMEYDRFIENDIANRLVEQVARLHSEFEFIARMGVYVVENSTVDVTLMCDRALLALRSIKDNYNTRIAYYDETMRAALIEEQEIVSEMLYALESGQFVIWLQPQYNYTEKTLHGAEALVRWQHPVKGIISPAKFIPVFERNGFISQLDEYVWEAVCRQQRQWIDRGISVIPVSVNVSRRDIYNPHLCELLNGLISKYGLDHSLLRLEITETAYMDNPGQLIKVVDNLRASGFAVEMDDFGSGYSSLNTLKDVHVDMLKLDMKFLESTDDDARSSSILTSIIRMAHWLKLPVIAEGVETLDQAEYLKSVGCFYMQGYFCDRPMPVEQYEEVLCRASLADLNESSFVNDIDGTENFLSTSTQETLLFNRFVGGALIVEYDGENVEALRINDKYFEVLGTTREEYQGKQLSIPERFTDESRERFIQTINRAIETREETGCEVCSKPFHEGEEPIWTRNHMRFLSRNANKYILYISIENITKQKLLTMKNTELTQQLSGIIENLPGGILDIELSDNIRIVYFNDTAANMFGYSRERYAELYSMTPLDGVYSEDCESVHRGFLDLAGGITENLDISFRHKCGDGSWKWTRLTLHTLRRRNGVTYGSGILSDIDAQVRNEQKAVKQAAQLEKQRIWHKTLYDTIPCGIMQFSITSSGESRLLSFNDTSWRIFGYDSRSSYVESVRGKSKLKDVHPDDYADVMKCIKTVCYDPETPRKDYDHRIICPDGSTRWLHVIFQRVTYPAEDSTVQVVFTDITNHKQENVLRINNALFSLYDEVYELNAEMNTSIMRFSRTRDYDCVGQVYSYSDFLRTLCDNFVHPDDRAKVEDYYNSMCASDSPALATLEYRYVIGDGGIRWISTMLIPVECGTCLNCSRDITELKTAQAIARDNEALQARINEQKVENERNRIFIEHSGVVMYDYYPDNDVIKIYRKEPDGKAGERVIENFMTGLDNHDIIAIADRKRVLNLMKKVLEAPVSETLEYRAKLFNDSFVQCRTHLTSIANGEGTVYRVVGQVSQVLDNQQLLLAEKLAEITGGNYKDALFQQELTLEVLRLLKESRDTDSAVQAVLSAVGKQTNVSRVYIIEETGDGRHCSNTYEWCGYGIRPEIDNLRNFEYPEGVHEVFVKMFSDNDGVLVSNDVKKLPEWLRDTLESQDIKSIIMCAIIHDGDFRGYVGFDECAEYRTWTDIERQTLRIISDVIASFLFTQRNGGGDELTSGIIRSADNSRALVYVVDADTCEILYNNNAVERVFGGHVKGERCYSAFMKCDRICEDCAFIKLVNTGVSTPQAVWRGNRQYIMQAYPFKWQNRKAVIVSGIDVSIFTNDLEEQLIKESERDIKRYTQALFGFYDEIFEINFIDDTFVMLLTVENKEEYANRLMNIEELTEKWTGKYLNESDRIAVKEFLNPDKIRESFKRGENPELTYTLRLDDDTERIISCTLLQLDFGRYLCCSRDITEQQRAGQLKEEIKILRARSDAQDLYRIVVEQTDTAVFEMNYQTGSFTASDAYRKYEISRYSEEAVLTNNCDRGLIHPEDQERLNKFFENTDDPALTHTGAVLRLKMTSGGYRWTRITGTFIYDNEGRRIKTIGTFTDVDDEIRTKIALEQLSERMSRIIANIPTGIAILELSDKIRPVYVSDKTCEIFGFTREEYDIRIANNEPVNYMLDMNELPEGSSEKLMDGSSLMLPNLHAQRKDGSRFWLRVFCTLEKKPEDKTLCYAVLADISDEVERDRHINQQMERYSILSEAIGTITFDYSVKDDVMRISGTSVEKGFTEEVFEDYLNNVANSHRIHAESKSSFIAALKNACKAPLNGTHDYQADYFGKGYCWYRTKFVSLADQNGEVYRLVGRVDDISDIVSTQNAMRTKMQIDGVTGIRNKDSATAVIAMALNEKPSDRYDAMLFIDIDNFKQINDTIGHYDADRVLHDIGQLLTEMFRSEDIVARYGGDEFIVYMQSAGSIENVKAKAEMLIKRVNSLSFGERHRVKCSAGVCGIIGDDCSFESVFKRADAALYMAKNSGKNQYIVSE